MTGRHGNLAHRVRQKPNIHRFCHCEGAIAIRKDVCDCGFPFKKSIINDQIAEMASLNFTALELSLFSRKKQRSKKIKTLYNCI